MTVYPAHPHTTPFALDAGLPQLTAVVFDFDGTLAIPTLDFALMRRAVIHALAPFTPEHLAPQAAAMPSLELIETVCALLDAAKAETAHNAAMHAIEEIEIQAAARSSLFPFVRPMLASLKEKGVACGVITRNCQKAVLGVFPDIAQHMGCLLTRHDVAHVKPHPEHLYRALHILGSPAETTLMVGDHPTDVETGQNAGTLTGAVTSGEATRSALEQANPTFLAHDAGELLQQLQLWNKSA